MGSPQTNLTDLYTEVVVVDRWGIVMSYLSTSPDTTH